MVELAMGVWHMSMADALALTDRQALALWHSYLKRSEFEARVLIGQLSLALQRKPKAPGNLAGLAGFGFGIEGA